MDGPNDVAADPAGNLFIAGTGDRVIEKVSFTAPPTLTPDGSSVIVVNADSGNVSVIDTSDDTVIDTVGFSRDSSGVAVSPDGAREYVVDTFGSQVGVLAVLDPSAPTALVATPGDGSASIAFTPGDPGGATITKYQFSTDSGATWADAEPGTTSPVTVRGLPNRTISTVKLRAAYVSGTGGASAACR